MEQLALPFDLPLTPEAFASLPSVKHHIRRLSDLRGYFSDSEALNRRLGEEDPIIYEFWEIEMDVTKRGMSFGITRTAPGKVGQEYHLSKGHFHADGEGDEIYIVIKGHGLLLLYSRTGECQSTEMIPGKLYYIPGHLAHRTVNIGDEPFEFISIWPPNIVHDYESVAESGFPKLVIEGPEGSPQLIDNPAFLKA